jgi:hypothetical protein
MEFSSEVVLELVGQDRWAIWTAARFMFRITGMHDMLGKANRQKTNHTTEKGMCVSTPEL